MSHTSPRAASAITLKQAQRNKVDGPGKRRSGQDVWRGARSAALAAASALLALASPAKTDPLPDNHYAIDVFQGPILAPIRVTGIAGAYAGNAEGISGMVSNAAAPAVREAYSVNHTEIDVAASISIPFSLFENNDFDNSGAIDYDYSNFVYLTLGGLIQIGAIGVGAIGELQGYTLTGARGETTTVTLGKYHMLAAWGLLDGQLMIGTGLRIATLNLRAPEATLGHAGVGTEVGVLLRPDWRPVRLGATFRFPVVAELVGSMPTVDERGVQRAGGLVLPERVVLPWELEVGLAMQLGPRPLNPAWLDPMEHEAGVRRTFERRKLERAAAREAALSIIADPAAREERRRVLAEDEAREMELDEALMGIELAKLQKQRRARYWRWPRENLLVTAELLVTGAVPHGVSIERFLGQNQPESAGSGSVVGTSGKEVSFSPRFGVETEPILNLVQTRLGSYYEPSRYGAPVGRQHFTFGADLKLFPTRWWGLTPEVMYKLQASLDLAPRYESASFGIGVWH